MLAFFLEGQYLYLGETLLKMMIQKVGYMPGFLPYSDISPLRLFLLVEMNKIRDWNTVSEKI